MLDKLNIFGLTIFVSVFFCLSSLDSEIVTFDLISLYTSIPHKFGLEAIDYFLTKYQEDLHPRFREEFDLEIANVILKKQNANI